jgi:hypothetical protein
VSGDWRRPPPWTRSAGLSQREGTDAVWDVLEMLDRRELLAFSTLMASELSETEFSAQD